VSRFGEFKRWLDLLDSADAAPLAESRRTGAADPKRPFDGLQAEIAKLKPEAGHLKAAQVEQDRGPIEMRAHRATYEGRGHERLSRDFARARQPMKHEEMQRGASSGMSTRSLTRLAIRIG
jgi:hypothetical protein